MKKILLILALAPALAIAPTPEPEPAQPPVQQEQIETPVSPIPEAPMVPEAAYRKQFIATLAALVIILLVIFIVIWVLRRFTPARVYQNNQKKNIKVLERRHLSPNTFLYHIQIGEKQFILAESKFHISTIATIDWNEQLDKE